MKKVLASLLVVLLSFGVLAGCTKTEDPPVSNPVTPPANDGGGSSVTPDPAPTDPAASGSTDSAGGTINVYAFTVEVPSMVTKYIELNPGSNLKMNETVIATDGGGYQSALNTALSAKGKDCPDMYAAESAFVLKYTQGDCKDYAATYKDLGIDIDAKIKDAQIAQYAVDIGTRDGQVVALPYQATGGAFIYRRSIANDVFGSDDPATIKGKIGPKMDDFWAAAEALKAKGYAIVSGDGDLWHMIENASAEGWVKNGKLQIPPEREVFLDYAKKLKDEGYSNLTGGWSEAWFADMRDEGPKGVFGFFGPAWLINYVMAGNSGGEKPGEGTYGDWAICEPTIGFSWGGTWVLGSKDGSNTALVKPVIEWITLDTTDTGLQYLWANGKFDGPTKDTVASKTVMDKSDGKLDFLGGQNMFDVFGPAGANATGKNKDQYDEEINIVWTDQVAQYVEGNKSRDEALAAFKSAVADQFGL